MDSLRTPLLPPSLVVAVCIVVVVVVVVACCWKRSKTNAYDSFDPIKHRTTQSTIPITRQQETDTTLGGATVQLV